AARRGGGAGSRAVPCRWRAIRGGPGGRRSRRRRFRRASADLLSGGLGSGNAGPGRPDRPAARCRDHASNRRVARLLRCAQRRNRGRGDGLAPGWTILSASSEGAGMYFSPGRVRFAAVWLCAATAACGGGDANEPPVGGGPAALEVSPSVVPVAPEETRPLEAVVKDAAGEALSS